MPRLSMFQMPSDGAGMNGNDTPVRSVPDHYRTGVIEGFYGRPWSESNRFQMIQQLHETGLNTYIHAPKFDLEHRWNWRHASSVNQRRHLRELCALGRSVDVSVVLSLSPGLSIDSHEETALVDRFLELAALEPGGLALLLDDIPYQRADPRFHSRLARAVQDRVPANMDLFFCPTAYSDWHLNNWPEARSYLDIIGRELPEQWMVFWTGKTIISREIAAGDLEDVRALIRRNPVIWDNFSADDYAPAQALFPGPLSGRHPAIVPVTAGLLLNPSEVFSASRAALYSLARWIRSPSEYSETAAFEEAVAALTDRDDMRDVLRDVLGYFYTPFGLSKTWDARFESVRSYLRDPLSETDIVKSLEAIRHRLRSEENIVRLQSIWLDLYPFTRTLLGDLDYLITACRRRAAGQPLPDCLPPRDPRWSTPLEKQIREHF